MAVEETQEQVATADELERRLEEQGHGLTPAQLSQTRVPLRSLREAAAVFQPRDFKQAPWQKEQHINQLARVVKEQGPRLDPITVFPVGGVRYVVDGHCRLRAYKQAGVGESEKVPVQHLSGTLVDALMHAIGNNSKDKLPLTLEEKTEHAWKLVKYYESRGAFSLRELATLTGVSKSTIGNMKSTLQEKREALGFEPRGLPWEEVKRRRRGEQDHGDEWMDKLAGDWARRLRKELGDKPETQTEIFYQAIEIAYPRAAAGLLEWLTERGEQGDPLEYVEEGPPDF